MANIWYYLAPPNPSIRKSMLKAQLEAYANHGILIYEDPPLRISLLRALVNRKSISYYFSNTLSSIELISNLELCKKREVLYNKDSIEHCLSVITGFFTILFGAYFTVKPKYEWLYKHKLFYMPLIPKSILFVRFLYGFSTFLVLRYRKSIASQLMPLYYPELLADLQISDRFELGYWSREFVKSLYNN